MPFRGEYLARDLKTELEASLPSALDVVEAEWSAIAPITLPDPVMWFLGHKRTAIDLYTADLPYIGIIVNEGKPIPGRKRATYGYQETAYTALIQYLVVADDEDDVNLRSWRYAQAIIAVLQATSKIGTYATLQKEYAPEVTLSPAYRHGKTENADMHIASEVDYMMAGLISVVFEVSQ